MKIRIKASTLRNAGILICQTGAACFLLGGLALDGSDLSARVGMAIILGSMAVFAAGYRLYKAGQHRERMLRTMRDNTRNRDRTFRTWLDCGTLRRQQQWRVYK